MRRMCLVALGCAALLGAPALAQVPQALTDMQARMNAAPDPTKPPVDSLTCEQMLAELAPAGMRMAGQLDPSFAANAQAAHDRMTGPPSTAPVADQVAQNHAQVNLLGSQVAGSMQGIDVQRMVALSTQFSAKGCKTPQ